MTKKELYLHLNSTSLKLNQDLSTLENAEQIEAAINDLRKWLEEVPDTILVKGVALNILSMCFDNIFNAYQFHFLSELIPTCIESILYTLQIEAY